MPEPQVVQPRAAELLAPVYRELLSSCESLRVRLLGPQEVPDGPGFVRADRLGAHLDGLVAGESARILAVHGREPRPHVAASRLLHHYLWSLCLLVSGPWYLSRRVPGISAEDLWIDLGTGDLALRPGAFACLPGDPAAGLPGTRVPGGEDELRAELRAAVADHLEPVLAVFQGPLKRGQRALWGMAADDLASGVWYLGRMLGDEEAGARAASLLLPGDTLPFPGAADFRRLAGTEGRTHLTRTRLGCCLYYAIRPEDTCVTCPRTCDAERVRRLEQPAATG
ncbi:(2Fe-2S)-binding protein [Kitasatospora sp. NPDC057223]|uniref:(2Fe-2S)-binding protein n=1 Tax=Kitasatospora sp. NPDC057223 TaxID=3346055 RepID=UPI00364219CA